MTNLNATAASGNKFRGFLFRWMLVFVPLLVLIHPNIYIPWFNDLHEWYIAYYHQLIVWFADKVLSLSYPITVFTNGSGDTTYDYVSVLFLLIVSFITAGIWMLRKPVIAWKPKAYYWLMVLLRYYAALTMIAYGCAKVIKVQMPYPSLHRLLQPYGESSPMGLAWTYLGFSGTYNYFMGIAELLAAFLLLFRRTTVLGALICLGVSTNIFFTNLSFDIPVKLLSGILVLISLAMLWPALGKLWSFFVSDKQVQLSTDQLYHTVQQPLLLRLFKYVLIIGFTYICVSDDLEAFERTKRVKTDTALYGIYTVTDFVRNGDTVPPLLTDSTRWHKLIVSGSSGFATVKMCNDSLKTIGFKADTLNHTLLFKPGRASVDSAVWVYRVEDHRLLLTGMLKTDSVRIGLQRVDHTKFRLLSRGFRWISEFPYNR